jgi:ATP-binding cassette subfamily B protein
MNGNKIRDTLRDLEGNAAMIALAVVCALIAAAGSLAAPRLIGRAIDLMGPSVSGGASIATVLGSLVAVYLIMNLFQWLLCLVTNRISYLTARNLRRALFDKLGVLPLAFFDDTSQGDTISRFVNDVDAVSDGLLQGLAQLLSGVATIIGATVFMFILNPTMAIVVIVLTPLSIFATRFIARNSQRKFRDQAEIVGSLNGYAEEMIEGRKEVKAFRLEDTALERFEETNRRLYAAGVSAQFYSSLANPSTRLVNNIAYSVVGVTGSLIAIEGGLTIGGISSFLIYATLFAKPFNDITNVLSQLQAALASARRIEAVLERASVEEEDERERPMPASSGGIRFEGVGFSYVPNQRLIEKLELEIPYGTSVAIVGRTGAGKTTLVNLLMRFYDVNAGRITLGGVDIRDFRRADLRRCFGMVLQDTWLFGGSLRDNIAYSKPEATDQEIAAAAKQAGADFIERLGRGYDTVIGASGEGLSQGQRQLVTIARVMLADPPIFILDEATSSIDTQTELRVQEALRRLTAGRTSFVIAHRLSTIRGADLILVLEDGHIVESGSHDELLERKGSYARMYASRFEPESVS